jgi:septal ring factor EnvC (AmiA/AmiB activator)
MAIDQIVNAVEIAIHKLAYMENLYQQAKDQAEKMQRTIQRLVTDIRALEYKISILDKTAFPIELDCKRKEQQVQAFTDKKNRSEKWITNFLNGEDYSKVKPIVKVLKQLYRKNKKLISDPLQQ